MRVLVGLITFAIAVATLWPSASTLPQHGDEKQYVWSAGYYAEKVARLDFAPVGTDELTNPGWNPEFYWNYTQPQGTRAVYALAMRIAGVPPPAQPYSYRYPEAAPEQTQIPRETLPVVRFAAVLCSALGLALIAGRVGALGPLVLLLLFIPDARHDLSRAWAEGPLLLGFGLAAVAFGARWFPPAVALAATFKLTALVLWPLMLLRGANGVGRFARASGIIGASVLFSLLTPQSWSAYGPPYLIYMLITRSSEFAQLSAREPTFLGLFIPSRYLWPVELVLIVVLIWLAQRTRERTFLRRRLAIGR